MIDEDLSVVQVERPPEVARTGRKNGAESKAPAVPVRDPQNTRSARPLYRRPAFIVAIVGLANLGAGGVTPVLERFHTPLRGGEKRWLEGLYVDTPEEWDDPYRYFGW